MPTYQIKSPTHFELDKITIRGAQQNNLKNISISIPKNKLVVITGPSGSGKSSLAFDTIFAEAQRRFVESLSPFIRHYLEKIDKPKIEYIGGLSPAIAIDQKKLSNNPRSTVGTITEISHYLRLLYSRIGTRYCLKCGTELRPLSPRQIANDILQSATTNASIKLLVPIIKREDGDHTEVLQQLKKEGYEFVRVNGVITTLDPLPTYSKSKKQNIELVVGNITLDKDGIEDSSSFIQRLVSEINKTLRIGNNVITVCINQVEKVYSSQLKCPNCHFAFPELTSQSFSFNSPYGMCMDCKGLGVKPEVDPALLIEDPALSILDGALTWFGNLRQNKKTTWPLGPLDVIANHYGVSLETPWQELTQKFRDVIFYGSGDEKIRFPPQSGLEEWVRPIKGLVPEISRLFRETESDSMRKKYSVFMRQKPCPTCRGTRLNHAARSVSLNSKNIAEVSLLPISDAIIWLNGLYETLDKIQIEIANDILEEIYNRLHFMAHVDLDYITLDRSAPSLSGGEGQRVRLASQLGSGLTGVLYILDEPSIGLHPYDQKNLVQTLCELRDMGNTVLVVEHDIETMNAADWLIDMGPAAGVLGGEIIATGTPSEIKANQDSLTGQYLSGRLQVTAPNGSNRRKPDSGWLTISGCKLNNLKNITAKFPIGLMTCVTGVSGSGKSSLVSETLEPALSRSLNHDDCIPGPYEKLEGIQHLENVVIITQDPIGRTPRSNPATYTQSFDIIRKVFASTQDAKKRHFTSSYFSFNTKGGRCENCQGHGQVKIEMHFLADVWVTCQECNGARYNFDTLGIKYKGKSISDVLDMDVREALDFFTGQPDIKRILGTLADVGLGYIKLGQSATTLSGGEAQRVKLAKELSKISLGRTIYFLDEPTTGLHSSDIQHLLNVLHKLVEAGNTVIIIEHNLDIIKNADWIIDMGPEGGEDGGKIIAQGTPEEIVHIQTSYTGQFLKQLLAS